MNRKYYYTMQHFHQTCHLEVFYARNISIKSFYWSQCINTCFAAGASKPPLVGSALWNIALFYGGYSEEESSSSSDESDYDQSATVQLAKITTADATIAMDTQEVEQSMNKIAVSSNSSSSSSEDEVG